MRRRWHQGEIGRAATSAAALFACAIPGSGRAADSAPATGRLQVEPSVGASLGLGTPSGVLLQVFVPGSSLQIALPAAGASLAARTAPLPGMLLSFEGAEIVADSAVSLRVELRAPDTASPDGIGEGEGEGGAVVILAQFN